MRGRHQNRRDEDLELDLLRRGREAATSPWLDARVKCLIALLVERLSAAEPAAAAPQASPAAASYWDWRRCPACASDRVVVQTRRPGKVSLTCLLCGSKRRSIADHPGRPRHERAKRIRRA